MFEELPFIFGFMIFSIIISYILIKCTPPPLSNIVKALAVVGIIFHELCHLLMCVICNAPIEKITLINREESEKNRGFTYFGEVKVREHNISFLQAFLISFAPLYFSFWLIFFLLNFLVNNQVHPLIFLPSIFMMISLSLSAAPSFSDLAIIPRAFQNGIYHSLYQILLVVISILTVWMLFVAFSFQYFHEILVYLMITVFYFIYKYGFKIIGYILKSIKRNWLEDYRSPKQIRFKRFTRSRYKPKKPRKLR